MTRLADLLSSLFERRDRRVSANGYEGRSAIELVNELVGSRGEMSGQAIAARILDVYDAMDDEQKTAFFQQIARHMDVAAEAVRAALADYEKSPGKATYRRFMAAAEPRRQELIRRLNQVPGATGRLVQMRADLLRLMPGQGDLSALDLDFRHLFASWFNRGFLVLRPISWQSPANVLEKIIAYEAVHAIGSWNDLRSRLEPPDRRCFAFFHPAMPDEPLIFVEVALTVGTPASIQGLLADDRDVIGAEDATTAVFYSISNCQSGLASISFGNSLIKQVISDVSRELPDIRTFVTLSPVPGLADWLKAEGVDLDPADDRMVRHWTARYLLTAKRDDGGPIDAVARFHLGNGAALHAVHAGADRSDRGLKQSLGAMVNYLYDPARLTANHERFAIQREVVASEDVTKLHQAPDASRQKQKRSA